MSKSTRQDKRRFCRLGRYIAILKPLKVTNRLTINYKDLQPFQSIEIKLLPNVCFRNLYLAVVIGQIPDTHGMIKYYVSIFTTKSYQL